MGACGSKQITKHINDDIEPVKCNKTIVSNIMIVDDVPDMAYMIKEYLELLGYNINSIYANSGQDAYTKYNENANSLGVIFMDIKMVPVDGIEATKILRENGCTIPIVGLTGMVDDETIDECKKNGMNKICSKPLDFKILIKTLDELNITLNK